MKTGYLLCLCTFITTNSFSQISIAARFGANIVTTKNLIAFPKNRLGWYAGMSAQVPLVHNFSLQPELLFSSKGYKSEDQFGSIYQSVRFNYLNLPLLVNYQIDDRLSIQAGPELGYLLSAQLIIDKENFNISEQYPPKIDAGISVGLQYRPLRRTSMEIRYTYGANTLYSVDANGVRFSDQKGANRAFQMGLNYTLLNTKSKNQP